jgi:hypothetical protein
MSEELSLPETNGQPTVSPPKKVDLTRQAIAGLTPPHQAEAMVREIWPSVVEAQSGLAVLGQKMMSSMVLAPLAWLLLAPLYFKKILPFLSKRYTLTNRRLMIQRGLKPRPVLEIALADIDDVRIATDSHNAFYKCSTVEILTNGKVAMTLTGVPEADSFRNAIINAVAAWVPGKAKTFRPFIAASVK